MTLPRTINAAGLSGLEVADDVVLAEVLPDRSLARRLGFYGLNLLIGLHMLAVVASPLSVTPASDLEQSIWSTLSPYIQLLYQNNGFHFFAPNPEGAYSIVYEYELPDGNVVSSKFPNREIWPRLMYHRHFMLSEFMGTLEGEELELMSRAIARRLCEKYGAIKISLSLQWHDLALRERILAGGTLYDADLYRVTPLGTYTWDDLSSTSTAASAVTSAE